MMSSGDFNVGDLQLARQIASVLRDVTPVAVNIENTDGFGSNTGGNALSAFQPSLAGKRGSIVAMWESGTGNAFITFQGADPTNNGYRLPSQPTSVPIHGIDFDQCLVEFSSTAGDAYFICEVYP